MGSGGEAEDADAVAIEMPLGGVGAGEAHGLLSIFEIGGVGGIVACIALGLRNAIFDEDAGDADGVEPVAGVGAFAIRYENLIAAAGEDEDRGSGVFAVGRIDGEGGDGDVGEADNAVATEETVSGLGGVSLGGVGLSGLGCGVGPEGKRDWLGLGVGGGGEKRHDEECAGDQAESWGDAFHADHTIPSSARTARSCA